MALIETTAVLKEYLAVDASNFPTTFLPSIKRAEESFIKKATGTGVYALITAANPTPDALALRDKARAALAPLAYCAMLPLLNVRAGDKGLTTSSTQTSEQARKWMVDDMRNQLLIDGYNALDGLYEHLESNTTADWYNTWKGSDAYTEYKQYFVNRAAIMQQYAHIKGSRWLYMQLLPGMQNVETFYILDTIGSAFFNDLKTKFRDETANSDEQYVIQSIQQIVSMIAFAEGLCNPAFVNEYAIIMASRSEDLKDGANSRDYSKLADGYMNRAQALINRLSAYLNANASPSVFTSYYGSEQYDAGSTGSSRLADRTNNDSSNGSFFLM